MLAMASVPSFAATYYVTPDGAGEKDGSSWENAFGVAEFRAQAEANANGDIYMFEGGLYNLSEKTVVFKTATGATLIGNAEGERTVFSGDKNGNNIGDSGDANRLIRFETVTANGNTSRTVLIENIDFTCVNTYYDTETTQTIGALVFLNSGDALVRGCRFYKNNAQGSLGGPATYVMYSTVKYENCMFHDNTAKSRGGAIRIYSNNASKGIVTLENCVLNNNSVSENLGGAIFMGHGNSLNIINSTITGNSAEKGRGAVLYFNGYAADHHREVRIVNSTIAGNTCGDTTDDAQIVSTNAAHINIVNSIITSDENVAAIKFVGTSANEAFEFVSGGFNYVGSVIEPAENEMVWAETDTHGNECTYSSIFKENKLNEDNVIKPAEFYLGATGEEVATAVSEWGLPEGLDLTVDQLGNPREGKVTPGAYAVKKDELSTGVIDAINDLDNASLIKLGNGMYAVEGIEGVATVYNAHGQMVMKADASGIDMSSLAKGLYIINAGNANFKVIK